MNNSINFTGSFLVMNPPKAAHTAILDIAGKRKLVHENFDNTTDVLYTIRKSKEDEVAHFLIDNNLRFKFFPKITRKSGLDPIKPQIAVDMVNRQETIFFKSFWLKKFGLMPEEKIVDTNVYGTAAALNLDPKNIKVRYKNGVSMVYTKDNKKLFKTSPVNQFGINYIYAPNSEGKIDKYMINGNKVLFKYPDTPSMQEAFDENFNNSIYNACIEVID